MASTSTTGLKSDLKRVRGLGSAKLGTKHFFHQRLTALANIPLSLITLWVVISSIGQDYAEVLDRMASPFVSPFILLFVLSAFYHASLGLANVIEDYIGGEGARLVALILMRFSLIVLAVVSVWSMVRILIVGA